MMSFSIGIVGLPNVGKSTLFKALTKKEVEIAPFPFTTISPNIATVKVPDRKFEKLSKIKNFEKITPAVIKFIDIAGLIKGAHKGLGLGNQFLAYIRECEGIVEVIRCFEEKEIPHPLGKIDPKEEIEILEYELMMKDLETVENALEKLKKKGEIKKISFLEKVKNWLDKGRKIKDLKLENNEKKFLSEYRFLTSKPVIYLFNTNKEERIKIPQREPSLTLDLKMETEFASLSEKEKKELKFSSKLNRFISLCYKILNLITFYTIAKEKEARAWTLKEGSTILKAAEKVHSDFKEKFVKGEVISIDKLLEIGSWKKARELGILKIVGRDYLVQNGDVLEFKI